MTPVFQTLTISENGQGNCFNACIASLLDLSLQDIPNILPKDPGDWRERWRYWLAEQGYKRETHSPLSPPEGYSIAVVLTDRVYPENHDKAGQKIYHACIALDGKVVHDPFPGRSIITEIIHYESFILLSEVEQNIHESKAKLGLCRHGYRISCQECLIA